MLKSPSWQSNLFLSFNHILIYWKLCSSEFSHSASSHAEAVQSFGHATRIWTVVSALMKFWKLYLLQMKALGVVWTKTRKKHFLFYLEDSPITRWCPTSDRLKRLHCLCNSVFWKLKVLCVSLLSPGEIVCAVLPVCVNETDTWRHFVFYPRLGYTRLWNCHLSWLIALTVNQLYIWLAVSLLILLNGEKVSLRHSDHAWCLSYCFALASQVFVIWRWPFSLPWKCLTYLNLSGHNIQWK